MKSRAGLLTCLGALGLFLILFPGCYTQTGSTRGEDERGEGAYQPQGQSQDSSYSQQGERNDYEDNYSQWQPRPYAGFSYYYPSYYWPSYAFNAAYCDPWSFNFGFNYGYSPYVPYPYSYGGYYSPYYASYYPYGYYPAYAYSKYGYVRNPVHRGSRSFGDTRGVSGGGRGATVQTQGDAAPPVVNTDRGGYNFPTGARMNATPMGSGVHNSTPPTVNTRPASPPRSSSVRGGPRSSGPGHAVRGWGGRRVAPRSDGSGDTQARPGGRETQAAPAAPAGRVNPGGHGGGRDSGAQRGSSSTPRPQAPASGGRTGGSNRGGRP